MLNLEMPNPDGRLTWFLVSGAPRSGTTLLQRVLNTHPNVACSHEYSLDRLKTIVDSYFIDEYEFAEVFAQKMDLPTISPSDASTIDEYHHLLNVEASALSGSGFLSPHKKYHGEKFFRAFYQIISGKEKLLAVGDKMPDLNALAFERLRSQFEGLRIIYIVRNPLDVVSSSLRRAKMTEKGLDAWLIRDVLSAIRQWQDNWEATARDIVQNPQSTLVVRYEDLVEDFKGVAKSLSTFLGIENQFKELTSRMPSRLRDFAIPDAERVEVEERLGYLIKNWDVTPLPVLLENHPHIITASISSGDTIGAGNEGLFALALREGFHDIERWGCWSRGEGPSVVRFKIEKAPSRATVILKINYTTVVEASRQFAFTVRVKGGERHHFDVFFAPEETEKVAELATEVHNGLIILEITVRNPNTPSNYIENGDDRLLGLGIIGISATLIENSKLQGPDS